MGQNSQEVTRAGAEILALWRVIVFLTEGSTDGFMGDLVDVAEFDQSVR